MHILRCYKVNDKLNIPYYGGKYKNSTSLGNSECVYTIIKSVNPYNGQNNGISSKINKIK